MCTYFAWSCFFLGKKFGFTQNLSWSVFWVVFFFNTIKTYHFILILFYWYLSKKIKKKSHIYIFINLLCILRLGQWRPPFHTARWEPSKDLSYWQKKSAQQHRNRATPSSAEQWWRPILTKWRQSDVTCPLHSVDWMTWGSTVTPTNFMPLLNEGRSSF